MTGKPETVSVPHLGGSTISYKFGKPYDPSLPTLVMINSFTTSMELYRAQFADSALIAAMNVLAIEPYGHGATRATWEQFTYWDSAVADLQVLEILGIPEAFVLGTSQGGWIAARMAMLAPDKVKGIIVLGTSMDDESQRSRDLGCWDGDEFVTPTIDEFFAPVGDDWVVTDDYVTKLLESGLGDTVTPEEHAFWLTTYRANYTGDAGRKRILVSAINLRDRDGLHARLYNVLCPVLWLHGSEDSVYSIANAREEIAMFTNSPSAEVRVVEGGQHFLSASNPAGRRSGDHPVRQPLELKSKADIRCTDCPLTVHQHEVTGPEQRHLHVAATRSRNKPTSIPTGKNPSMPHTQQVIAVRDTHLFVDDTGEDDLPVILCLHSLFLDSRMFDGLVDAVRGEFRVVRPEFRGQGRSDFHDVDIITMDDDAEDILTLIDLMGLKNINMLVQSMGGDVGVRVAARRPELFRRIVMAGSSARGETHESYVAWTERASVNGFVGDVLDETLAVMFGETIRNDPERADIVALWADRINALPRSLRPAMLGVMTRPSALDLLPHIPCPVLIFSGVEDHARPPEWAKEVADALPDSELVVLDRVGHSPTLEVPDTVYPRMIDFFRS